LQAKSLTSLRVKDPLHGQCGRADFVARNMRNGRQELVVLSGQRPEASDLNLIKLAAFIGVPARRVTLAGECDNIWQLIAQQARDGECAVCVNASTLRKCLERRVPSQSARVELANSALQLFVYNLDADTGDSELVRALSCGAFDSVRRIRPSESQYSVEKNSKAFCQEFSGLTFGKTDPRNDAVFRRAQSDERTSEHIRIGPDPFLAGIQHARGLVMLAGTRQVVDIDEVFPTDVRLLDWFSKLVPVMLFLRYVFGERSWQGARKLASFIVDDPLLTDRYGFLEYEPLLRAMDQNHFATNLAFIPWNYRRSQPRVTELFRQHRDRLSLSVHGCDHTKAEFATTQEHALRKKARVAIERMEAHQRLTQVPFDRVMVFPGGHFSSAALKALKETGYLAAVNSTEFAVDCGPQVLRLRDVLDVAVMRYSNFPLFIRRYPDRIAEFALDLFLGKPALLVAHHEYFKNGYEPIQAFAEQINRLSEGIKWCGLGEVARHTSQRRLDGNGTVYVRFFSNELAVANPEPAVRRFQLLRDWDSPTALPRVILRGREVPVQRSENGFCLEVDLQPGEALELKVAAATGLLENWDAKESFAYQMKVFARRHLCEFRDNYISRGRRLFE